MNKEQMITVEKEEVLIPVKSEIEALISQAIDKNVNVETMEKLLSMRRELKAEKAKGDFDKAMAKFQSECPIIEKTKEVYTNTGKVAYKFAPIESIIEQVKPILKDNGFSYSTNMKLLQDGVEVHVRVTHSSGHSETTDMTVPFGNKTNVMSQTQVVAAAQTFAKRYAFCNAFGIMTSDEDTDEEPKTQPQNVNDLAIDEESRKLIMGCNDLGTLFQTCHDMRKKMGVKYDKNIIMYYGRRKLELSKGGAKS